MDLPRRACARLCAGLTLAALLPGARAQTPKLNDTYRVIAQQPLQTDGRIEVIDFFWYGCPYCNELQPHLEKWRQSMPPDVVLRRIPAIRRDAWVPHARIYYTLEALGELERLHLEVYRSYHKDELYMSQSDVMLDWARRNGIDRRRWSDAYNSVDVMKKIEQARRATADYDIQGTPSLVVDGLYLTSSGLTEKVTDVIPILDGLVKLAREKRRARP